MLNIKQRVRKVLVDIELEGVYFHKENANSIDCYRCGDKDNVLVGRISFLDSGFTIEPIEDYDFLKMFEKCVLNRKKYGLRKTRTF